MMHPWLQLGFFAPCRAVSCFFRLFAPAESLWKKCLPRPKEGNSELNPSFCSAVFAVAGQYKFVRVTESGRALKWRAALFSCFVTILLTQHHISVLGNGNTYNRHNVAFSQRNESLGTMDNNLVIIFLYLLAATVFSKSWTVTASWLALKLIEVMKAQPAHVIWRHRIEPWQELQAAWYLCC